VSVARNDDVELAWELRINLVKFYDINSNLLPICSCQIATFRHIIRLRVMYCTEGCPSKQWYVTGWWWQWVCTAVCSHDIADVCYQVWDSLILQLYLGFCFSWCDEMERWWWIIHALSLATVLEAWYITQYIPALHPTPTPQFMFQSLRHSPVDSNSTLTIARHDHE